MALPNLPIQGQNPWFTSRNDWDLAVKAELEGRLSESMLNNSLLRGLSVKSFGAVGDGTTNDTAAIVAAESAAAAFGSSVWFPAGTYMTGGFQTRVSLRGDRATIKLRATNPTVVEVTASEVEIDNLVLDGNNLATGSVVDFTTGRAGGTLSRCEVRSAQGTGTVTLVRIRGNCHRTTIRGCWIHGCVSTTVGRGILVSGTGDPIGVKVVNSIVEDVSPATDGDGIVIQDFAGVVDVMIQGNTIRRCRKRGIKIQCPGVIVTGNRIFTDYDAGQAQQAYSGVSVYAPLTHINNNIITGVFGTAAIEIGSSFSAISDVDVCDNTLLGDIPNRQGSGDGISVDSSTPSITRVHFSRNSIVGVRHGIRFQNIIDQSEAVDNHFTSLSGSAYVVDDNNIGTTAQVRIGGGSIKSVANYSVTTDGGAAPSVLVIEPIIGAGGFGVFGSNAAAGVKSATSGVNPVSRAASIASPTAPGATYSQAEMASIKAAVDALRTANSAFGITSP